MTKARGTFVRTFKAVAWSFFGVRKASEYEKDVAQLNPLHVIVLAWLSRRCLSRCWRYW